ncbi:MAG: glycerophosphodiester phosphodiesterase [Betaproteobacteria bacterium]
MKPQVVAHRGSSALHAENSWAAFEAAVAEGADAIECDIQGTSDGELVIRHDLSIANRLVAECSAAEIDALEPGLVRLTDLLAWAPRVHVGLLLEIKDPAVARAVGVLAAASVGRERIVIGSFHAPALAAAKLGAPGVATSLMIGSVLAPDDLIRLATAYRLDGVHPCWEHRSPYPHRLLDTDAIARLREARLAITLWHEEREVELLELVALGPDAICTNLPALLRRIVDRSTTEAGRDVARVVGSK